MECLSSRREREAPGGRARENENSSRRHPRKFGQKRFLAVRRSWRGSGVACFWATSLEKIFGGVIAISYPFGREHGRHRAVKRRSSSRCSATMRVIGFLHPGSVADAAAGS